MNIKDEVKKTIQSCLELNEMEIENDDNLIEKFSINSIDAIGIFLTIEDVFGIQIADEDLGIALISSINSICDYIEKRKCK